MAASGSSDPPKSDAGMEGRKAWSRAPSSAFVWVSSSPSPAEVAELEKLFPEVVQVPNEALEVGTAEWEQSAIVARSFLRWIPPEAVIREFRRAGIPGEIEAVSLAFRCSIFKFSDANGKKMALERAWVVNGQPLATEPWSPEFFPSSEAVAKALLWIRLPSLPLEFWSEEILSSILAPAGTLVSLDSQTKQRNRGAFARACVRVDLSRALRPGVRVRGSRSPFWQPFQYEHLEGLCPRCGSLHLNGVCEAHAEKEALAGGLLFGPWMSAVRHRRASPSPDEDLRRKGHGVQSAARVSVLADGWVAPSKLARRRSSLHPSAAVSKVSPSSSSSHAGSKIQLEAVPVFSARAGFKEVKENIQTEAIKSHSLASVNPFASLDLISDDAGHDKVGVKVSGPLKRARPAECLPPRAIPNLDKRKGKGKSKMVNCRVDFISSSHIPPLPFCGQTSDREEVEVISVCPADRMSVPPSVVALDQGSLNTAADPVVMQEYSTQNDVEGSGSDGHHPDSLMIEDQVVVQAISN